MSSSDGDREPVGKVTDYFWKREQVRINVTRGTVREGDRLHVQGEFTDEIIDVHDMQIDEEPVEEAHEGDTFLMPLSAQQRVVLGDRVYEVDE